MPTTEIAKKVATAKRYTKLVECFRDGLEDNDISDLGYVVDASDEFVMLQLVDDRISLNGYSLLRISDITNLNPLTYNGLSELLLATDCALLNV